MKTSARRASFVLLAAGFAACAPPSCGPALPGPQPPPADQVAAQDSQAMAIDRALRTNIPGYVGLGFGLEGQLLVTLANEADIAAAQQLSDEVWSRVATEREYTPVRRPRFQAIITAIGPQDLAAAFAAMRDVLTLPNVVFLDLDEVCGCITVGISNASADTAVSAFAAQRGLQQGVVRTVLTAPVVRNQSLSSRFRPTVGGIEITAGGTCTLGLPVYLFGQSRYGFLTAAHCTTNQGGADATSFFQEAAPVPGAVTVTAGEPPPPPPPIGIEIIDPPMFDNAADTDCPLNRRCRYSDVAFATYFDVNLGRIGRIARPASTCGAAECALAVPRLTDDIRVTLTSRGGAFMGESLHKIGRTTGWTSGRVSRTCAAVNVANSDITLLCQYWVDAASRGGDSGSPVFYFSETTGTATFEGILWGGPETAPFNSFAYSPVAGSFTECTPSCGIERELGAIVYNQQGLASPFFSNGRFFTSNVDDAMDVVVERNAVPPDRVEFVLNGGARITAPKEVVLVEGTNPPATGAGRWTLGVTRNGDTARDGLFLYQLPGGRLEFRRREPGSNAMIEVSRVPIDNIAPGTRVTFTWVDD